MRAIYEGLQTETKSIKTDILKSEVRAKCGGPPLLQVWEVTLHRDGEEKGLGGGK